MGKRKKKTEAAVKGGWWRRLLHLDPEQQAGMGRKAKVVGAVLFLVVLVVGMRLLEGYVAGVARQRGVRLKVQLLNPPAWASDRLVRDICLSSGIRRDDFLLDKDLPGQWAANLAVNPWIKQVKKVHRRYDGLVQIECELRRPIAYVEQSDGVFYLDSEGVVLPDATLVGGARHVVKLRGEVAALPGAGETVDSAAVMAGLQVLTLIRQVDEAMPEDERLWMELAAMDVSNYEGREDLFRPHLALYTRNMTEVRWGAAVGRARPYHEASEKSKLSTLYRAHKHMGTLACYQFVELRDEGREIADPLRDQSG